LGFYGLVIPSFAETYASAGTGGYSMPISACSIKSHDAGVFHSTVTSCAGLLTSTLMTPVTYSPCLKAGASAVNAGCRAFRRDFHRLRQYEMMPHLKTQTLLVEYFTWQPICHNRLYSVVKVPRLAQLPGFTPRAMRQLNEWKYSANGFKLQDFLRLISPYLKLGALRRFSVRP